VVRRGIPSVSDDAGEARRFAIEAERHEFTANARIVVDSGTDEIIFMSRSVVDPRVVRLKSGLLIWDVPFPPEVP
jgi:hypothetical protein